MKFLIGMLVVSGFMISAEAAYTGQLKCESELRSGSEITAKWDLPMQPATEMKVSLSSLTIDKTLTAADFTSEVTYSGTRLNIPHTINLYHRPKVVTDVKSVILFVALNGAIAPDGGYYAFGKVFAENANSQTTFGSVRCLWYQ